jgi:hypothetical protein
MGLSAGERTYFLMTCPRCGRGTCKQVDWLSIERRMQCSSSKCRAVIDLKAPRHQQLIEILVDHAAQVDELLASTGSTD